VGACLAAKSTVSDGFRTSSKNIGQCASSLPSFASIHVHSRFVCHLRLVPSLADATFLAFFPAQTVEIDDHNNQATGNDPLPEGIHV